LLPLLPEGRFKTELLAWDLLASPESVAAHAFYLLHQRACQVMAVVIGGEGFARLLQVSELDVWFLDAFDRHLSDFSAWSFGEQRALQQALANECQKEIRPWGDVQRCRMRNMVLGALPASLAVSLGFDR